MKMIVITGPDASGKDTQIEKITQNLKAHGHKVQSLSIQNSLEDFMEISDRKTISLFLNVFLLKFDPLARSYFLLSLLQNSLSKVDPQADVILYNGYWYKYAASESAYGVSEAIWNNFAAQLPKPDGVVILKSSLETCLLRRTQWSPYESGQGKISLELHSFQKKMRKSLSALLDQVALPKSEINGDQSEDLVTEEILSIILPIVTKK